MFDRFVVDSAKKFGLCGREQVKEQEFPPIAGFYLVFEAFFLFRLTGGNSVNLREVCEIFGKFAVNRSACVMC